MKSRYLKKLIIIPAYNEEQNIVKVIDDITKNATEFDYIIINDCSTDNTEKICREKGYNIVSLPTNLGIGGGVQTGYKYALENAYDIAIQIDGDGQHKAECIPMLLKYMEENKADMVIGSRYIEGEGFQSTYMRRLGSRVLGYLLKRVSGTVITDPTSGLRMVNREIIREFCRYYPTDYPEPESIASILRKGYKVMEVPVVMDEREAGVSSINPIKSVYYMIKVCLAILIDSLKTKGREQKI